jgi:hypothetical protein
MFTVNIHSETPFPNSPMKPLFVLVDYFQGKDGSPDEVIAVMVENGNRLFREEFTAETEASSVLENLITWTFQDVPAEQQLETKIQLVLCRPHTFLRFTSAFSWIGKHNFMCFATYLSAFSDLSVSDIRARYEIAILGEKNKVAIMQKYASIFRDLLYCWRHKICGES